MDYVSLFRAYKIPFDSYRAGRGWVNTACPYCGPSDSYHLGFNITHDYCTCFKCGGHSLRLSLQSILGVPPARLDDALAPFQTRNHVLTALNEKAAPKATSLELPGWPLSLREKSYLRERNFKPSALVNSFNIQGGGPAGPWKNRIILPIYVGGKLAAWTARTVVPDREPRYKNLSIEESVIDCKKTFFNLDGCPHDFVFLLEGPFDVLRFGEDSICGFGISLTKTQTNYLASRFKKVFILFDSERRAQRRAKETAALLEGVGVDSFIGAVFSDYGCKDAGEMDPADMKKLKQELYRIV
jgi:hypothetical protein